MLVLLDHRDSFTYNLAQALEVLGAPLQVRAAGRTSLATLRRLRPTHLLLGPGPGRPEAARLALEVVRELSPSIPTLGVCLGHQVMAVAFGGRVERAAVPMHGRAVRVRHDGRGVFRSLGDPLTLARYNSLTVANARLPPCLEISARSEDGDVMGLRHKTWPLEGVQFHPESVLSTGGMELLANFLRT